MKISVVGQGYVGLPLSISAAKVGFSVVGIDTNITKIESLRSGKSFIEGVSDETLCEALESKKYVPSSDFKDISSSKIVVVCVPTPLSKDQKPDLSFLLNATSEIGKNLSPETLVIFESTIEPGTTRQLLLPLLVNESGLLESDFGLAFSPERIDPANKNWSLSNTPKIISALTETAAMDAKTFYDEFIESTYICSSLEVAETAKLLENSFRLVNISYVNELSLFCNKIGVNVNEVIAAAATKPYGFMPFYPSLGVGGHCIPVDPVYLANAAKKVGAPTRFIDLAVRINHEMPDYYVSRAIELIGELSEKKVLVIGVSYKPNVADVRETPVEGLIVRLEQKGAKVYWHDDLVKDWKGNSSVPLSSNFDLAILCTPHDYLNLAKIGNVPILNTRGSV
jgi:UDP-N-acetyl-D-glucosamine dehydrogenase